MGKKNKKKDHVLADELAKILEKRKEADTRPAPETRAPVAEIKVPTPPPENSGEPPAEVVDDQTLFENAVARLGRGDIYQGKFGAPNVAHDRPSREEHEDSDVTEPDERREKVGELRDRALFEELLKEY